MMNCSINWNVVWHPRLAPPNDSETAYVRVPRVRVKVAVYHGPVRKVHGAVHIGGRKLPKSARRGADHRPSVMDEPTGQG